MTRWSSAACTAACAFWCAARLAWTSATIAGESRSSSGHKSIHDSSSLLPSIWNLVIHVIESPFPRLFFMNLMNLKRKTVWAPFTKCGLSVLLKYSTPLPFGCLSSSLSSNLLKTKAPLSRRFLSAGPHFSDSNSVILYCIFKCKPWCLAIKSRWDFSRHLCCRHQLASMRLHRLIANDS